MVQPPIDVESAVGMDPDSRRQPAIRHVMTDAVEVDAARSALVPPARELAVDAVDGSLHLDHGERDERPTQMRHRHRQRRDPGPAISIVQVMAFGVIRVGDQEPGDVDRDAPL